MANILPLSARDVLLDIEAASKKGVLQFLAAEAAKRLGTPEQDILDALKAREKVGSTALGRGMALPHARMPGGIAPLVIFTRLLKPINYEAPDQEPVDIVIMTLWPEEAPEGFLPLLSDTCRAVREPQVRQRLRSAKTPDEVVAILGSGPSGAATAGGRGPA